MANGPDILGAISQGLALREQRQGAPARRELQGLQLQGARDQARVQSIIQSAQQLKLITTPEGKIDFLQQQRAQRQQAGTGTQEIDEALELAQAGRFDLLEDITDRAISFGQQAGGRAGVQFGGQETLKDEAGNLFFATTKRDPRTGQVTPALTSISGQNIQPQGQLQPISGAGLTPQEKLAQKEKIEGIKTTESEKRAIDKLTVARKQGFVDSGIEAADSLANIKRSKQLLNDVKTGGFNAAALRAKQLFGIESADEAELSAGLGKSILSQLRPIFGAAFTEREGQRLERIEASFGKSTEGNKRLLEQLLTIVERSARRGLAAAEDVGDNFTADEIKGALTFEIEPIQAQPEPTNIQQLSDEDLFNF